MIGRTRASRAHRSLALNGMVLLATGVKSRSRLFIPSPGRVDIRNTLSGQSTAAVRKSSLPGLCQHRTTAIASGHPVHFMDLVRPSTCLMDDTTPRGTHRRGARLFSGGSQAVCFDGVRY